MAGLGGSYTNQNNWPKDPRWRGPGAVTFGIFICLVCTLCLLGLGWMVLTAL